MSDVFVNFYNIYVASFMHGGCNVIIEQHVYNVLVTLIRLDIVEGF